MHFEKRCLYLSIESYHDLLQQQQTQIDIRIPRALDLVPNPGVLRRFLIIFEI